MTGLLFDYYCTCYLLGDGPSTDKLEFFENRRKCSPSQFVVRVKCDLVYDRVKIKSYWC